MSFPLRMQALEERVSSLPGAVVAFSGGADSAMLAHVCNRLLAGRTLAVTADSPSLPRHELRQAEAFAAAHRIRHLVIETRELHREGYRRNAADRCYFCKTELFEVMAARLREVADQAGGARRQGWPLLYGAIADDLADHRPGARAAAEHGVLAPMADAGVTKDDVRRYSRRHGLSTADKPASACLSSRVPYGTRIDRRLLARIEESERALRVLGFRQFRVRHHGVVARLELPPNDLQRALQLRLQIAEALRTAGYTYVALDLLGYRSGSMNEVLQ